jgi:subtilisin family serine protease
VAGIAAGRIATGAPANGVAPSAGIMAVQVFTRVDNPMICGDDSACFLSYTSDLKLALELVAQVATVYNIAAVNMSLGGGGPFAGPCDGNAEAAALKPEFDALVAQGVAPVVAAGNEGFRNGVASPACVSTAVTVGATDDYDGLAWFTNRGPLLDVFAPGVSVVSSVPGGTYASMSGTSMAAPHVTGLFALMRQAYPGFTVAQSLARLRSTGKAIPYSVNGASVSTPRIDAERATSAAARAAV